MIGALARAGLSPAAGPAGGRRLLIARVGVDAGDLERLFAPGRPAAMDRDREGAGWYGEAVRDVVDLDEIEVGRPLAENSVDHLLLLAGTMTDLRRAVAVRTLLPDARNVTIAVGALPYLRPAPLPVASGHPGWRHLRDLRVRLIEKRSWVLETEFSQPLPAGEVLAAAARAFGGDRLDAMPQPRAALAGTGATHWRPGDPNVVLSPTPHKGDCDVVLVAGPEAAAPSPSDGSHDQADGRGAGGAPATDHGGRARDASTGRGVGHAATGPASRVRTTSAGDPAEAPGEHRPAHRTTGTSDGRATNAGDTDHHPDHHPDHHTADQHGGIAPPITRAAGPGAGAGLHADTDARGRTRPDARAGTRPDVGADARADAGLGAHADAGPDGSAGPDAVVGPDLAAGAGPDADTGPDGDTGPAPGASASPDADNGSHGGADAIADTGPDGNAGPGADAGPDPGAGAGPNTDAGSRASAVRGTQGAGVSVHAEELPVVARPEPVAWSRFVEPSGYAHLADLSDMSMVPPVDERSVNPGGFLQTPPHGYGWLEQREGRWAAVYDGRVLVRFAASGGVTDADVARLRRLRGLRVEWRLSHTGPIPAARVIVGLAAAGVPLIAADTPDWARPLLGAELCGLITGITETDLDDDLDREVHSVRLRRHALRTHGTRARWHQLTADEVPGAGLAWLPGGPAPKVSVVLCTRRADMLRFAISQVARQRGVDVELVLGLHGVPRSKVEETVRSVPFPVTVCEVDPSLPLGAVLNQAFARASGTFVTKMDDDDWYGPEHLADLALAQLYSGADMLGAPAEFVHLEQIGVTVQRSRRTECFRDTVAGGTLFMSRTLFETVGGFRPVPRHVDGEFCRAVRAAGGRIYQVHGLNYILRRRAAQGHTWREPIGYFLAQRNRRQWRGWYANPLMEL